VLGAVAGPSVALASAEAGVGREHAAPGKHSATATAMLRNIRCYDCIAHAALTAEHEERES